MVRPGIRGAVVSCQRSSGTEVQCEFWVWSRCVWCLFSGAGASTCATKSASRSISTAFPVPFHSFSGIIKLADHLACMAVAMSTADNKFTAASIYAMENRHHAHSCSGLDFATRAFFYYLEVAPAFVVRRLCGLVCGTNLSLCNAPCCHFVFNLQSHAVCYLALVSLSVCDLLYSCSTVPCRSVIEVVPCFGSATLSHVCWVFLRIVACCGAGLLGRSCYSQVVRRIVACVLFYVVLFHTLPCHQGRLVRHQELRLCCAK